MPELLEQSVPTGSRSAAPPGAGIPPATGGHARVREDVERLAREDLRRQIGQLERELGELFATAFPRTGIDFGVAAAGGPRVLGVADLEAVRDVLAARLQRAQAELSDRVDVEEQNREVIERMIAEPDRYRWVRVSNDGLVYVCDRENNRIQIFSADGKFLTMWPDLRRPLDISIDREGIFYISEGGVTGLSPRISLMDKHGTVVARWDSLAAHGSWVDAHGDIYLALGAKERVDKYVRQS